MEKIIEFLKGNKVTVLATCSENKPRASVLEYVMVGNSLLFATDGDSIKGKNLNANKRLSLSVNSMPQFVTIDGSATEPTAAEIAEYNKVLFERHPEFKEMVAKGMMHPFTYFKVVIEKAYFNDYSNGMSPTEVISA